MTRFCVVLGLASLLACGDDALEVSATADTSGGSTSDSPPSTATSPSSSADSSSGANEASSAPGSSSDDTDATDTSGSTTGELAPSTRYDQVAQKSVHNAYQRHEAFLDQLVYHRIRSLEVDIHVGKSFEPTTSGQWYVYHTDITDDATWCVHLEDCLAAVASYTRAVPDHEVLTLWVDLKDPWDDTHGPGELDLALRNAFGDALATPDELRARCGADDAQSALLAEDCGWPTLDALRGRVLVMLTGGGSVLREYHDASPAERAAWVAPALGELADAGDWPNTAVFNFEIVDVDLAAAFVEAGYVTRAWGVDDEASWDAARNAGVHHLGTDMVNTAEDPWARTHDDAGYPFACAQDCDMDASADATTTVGIEVDSGDLWSTADSGWFLHQDRSASPEGTWQAFVSTVNSHVEPFAKGCLMARASLDANAPNFAVCRPADDEPLRIQWRSTPGGSSEAIEDDITPPDTLDPPGAAFVRMRIDRNGMCAAGDGSADGITWIEIGSACFDAPLVLQGIGASSHDAGTVRMLFGNVVLDDATPLAVADFPVSGAIGSARATVFDGVLP